MAIGVESGITPIINEVITTPSTHLPLIGTSNPDKLNEIATAFGIPVEDLIIADTSFHEIQDPNPANVLRQKAIDAYIVNKGRPTLVEDVSMDIPAVRKLFTPTFVKYWGEDPNSRHQICDLVQESGDTRASVQVGYAVWDGNKLHTRLAMTHGTIASNPRGSALFGFDDIFEPDGQEELETYTGKRRTFAEMKKEEKAQLFARQEALKKIQEDPFALGTWVFALNEALNMELDAIDKEYFSGPEMEQARRHAFNLTVLGDIEPNEDLEVDPELLPPLHEVKLHGDIWQITHNPDSPNLGMVYTSYELRKLLNGTPTRLMINPDGRPTFLQHGPKSLKRALASRAHEFAIHHNPQRYEVLRNLIQKPTLQRSNNPSQIIETLIGMAKFNPSIGLTELDDIVRDSTSVPGFPDIAYARESSNRSLSRTKAGDNLIINRNGIPTSILALGGMPPVTGSKDVVTTAATSFMRSYIPHNSLFVDFDRRKRMFTECKEQVEESILGEENEDMRELAVAQIGVCMSGTDMEQIQDQTEQLIEIGCRCVRLYTTNPGKEVVNSAEEICRIASELNLTKQNKEELPFHLCVGPVVDVKQAKNLQKIAAKYGIALTLLAGHGGGENCTSLEGGAAANAIEIVYALSLDENFNNVSLGFEGGLGTLVGPWMGIIDQVSKDGSLVGGCVETQGGISLLHKSNVPVQLYPGTASPTTQSLEEALFSELVHRVNPAGQLKNNEGKPNFMKVAHWAPSIVNYFAAYRALIGRTLADQQSMSIDERIEQINLHGYNSHRGHGVSAVNTANHHRGV